MTLYRKHRPQKFADIIGQEHVKKVLTNALMQDKIGHAYLFSGPRGSGKTTIARLLAKSLNCQKVRRSGAGDRKSDKENLISDVRYLKSEPFEPCNECISCIEITGDRSMDVIEIDAASNRGIDEIRELRDKVRYAPSNSRFKIYIIDEVHMLTKEAFNALLKTLEEPPKHAIFIMATTELHKVPDTILSRTQQFDFKRASIKELIDNLVNIAKCEKIKISSEALDIIARAGDGSFRDCVSILDQVSSISQDEISENEVKEILGMVSKKTLDEFISYLENNNVQKAVELINQIYNEGYDLTQFNQTIIESLRQKMLKTGDYNLLVLIKKFIEAGLEMKYAVIPQIPLELAVIELCNTGTQEHQNIETNNSKFQITNDKYQINSKLQVPINKPEIEKLSTNRVDPESQKENINEKVVEKKSVLSVNEKLVISVVKEKWTEVVNDISKENHSLGILLQESQPMEIKNGKLMLGVKFKFYAEQISASNKINILHSSIEKILGEKLWVECVVEDKLKVTRLDSMKARMESKKLKVGDGNIINNDLINDALEVFGE